MQHHIVTAENIEDVRNDVPALDQRNTLVPGCETWGIIHTGGQRGQMTIWPDGSGAIDLGGDSLYGEWNSKFGVLTLYDRDGEDELINYDSAGQRFRYDEDSERVYG